MEASAVAAALRRAAATLGSAAWCGARAAVAYGRSTLASAAAGGLGAARGARRAAGFLGAVSIVVIAAASRKRYSRECR